MGLRESSATPEQDLVIEPDTPFPSRISSLAETAVQVRPKTKLKQMHWDKLANVKGTFWSEAQDEDVTANLLRSGVFDEMERLFPVTSQPPKGKEKAKKAVDLKLSFIPRGLAQQFGINLYAFSALSEEQLVEKILRCDPDVVNSLNILEFFNKPELLEIGEQLTKQLEPYSGINPLQDARELQRMDRVFLETCFNLRGYWKARSRALLFVKTYDRDVRELEEKLVRISESTVMVKTSTRFRNILIVIKVLGNFMNDASKQSQGFKLDSLQKMRFLKTSDNSVSFLHYIERVVRMSFTELGDFADDLRDLLNAVNLSIEQVELECEQFASLVTNLDASMTRGNLSDKTKFHSKDQFLRVVTAPLNNARLRNQTLQAHRRETAAEFNLLLEAFGENPRDPNARASFFGKIANFVGEYKKVYLENIQKEEEEKIYLARKLKLEARNPPAPVVSRNPDLKGSVSRLSEVARAEGGEESVIDTLLEKLKASGPSLHRQGSQSSRTRRRRTVSIIGLEPPLSTASATLREPRASNSLQRLKSRISDRDRTPLGGERNQRHQRGKDDEVISRAYTLLNSLKDYNLEVEVNLVPPKSPKLREAEEVILIPSDSSGEGELMA